MKKILVISLIFFAAFSPLHLNNEYLRCSSFDTVTTRTGDTLLTIAERYTVNEDDREKLVEAISDINSLPIDGPLPSGRAIQVPLLPASGLGQVVQNR